MSIANNLVQFNHKKYLSAVGVHEISVLFASAYTRDSKIYPNLWAKFEDGSMITIKECGMVEEYYGVGLNTHVQEVVV